MGWSGRSGRADGYEFKILGQDPGGPRRRLLFRHALSIPREKLTERSGGWRWPPGGGHDRVSAHRGFLRDQGEKLLLTATEGCGRLRDHLRIDNEKGVRPGAIVPNRRGRHLKLLSQGEPTFSWIGDP
jgi:hypothetical protein